jgi:hypothetical protein
MGAARFPEQIIERAQAGRRAMLEDRTLHPVMETLRSLPVDRKVEPEEKNVRRKLGKKRRPRSRKERRRQWSKEITRLWTTGEGRSVSPRIKDRMQRMAEEIDLLRDVVKRQKVQLDRLKAKRP